MYFQVRGSNIHETVILDVIFRILEESGGRWASAFIFGRLCRFSNMRNFRKIYFPESLTVGLSSNLDIWFITCYFVV